MNAFFQIFSRITVENDIGLILLTALVSVLCLCDVIYVLWYLHLWSKARNWMRVDGRIIDCQVSIDRHGSEAPKLKIHYQYSIDNRVFDGKKIHLGWHRDRPNIVVIREYRNIFENNGVIQVFVDSDNYERSTLDVSFDVGGIIFLLCIFLAGVLSISLFSNLP